MSRLIAILVLTAAALPATARLAAAEPPVDGDARIAFLGLTWLDTSTEGAYNGTRADETARLRMISAMVTDRFAAEGFDLVDTAPVAQKLASTTNPAKCYGCDARMGAELGADYVLVGEVQKVSNLILSMNLQLRDVDGGANVAGRSVEIRSNTDESWRRGMRYLLDNAIFGDRP